MVSLNLATLRQNYHYTGHLCIIPTTVIWSRAINQATFVYPVLTLTFDDAYSGVGSDGDVKTDMTIIIRDGNTDTINARLRVAAGAVSGTSLNVNEVGNNLVDFADNDRIDVVDEYRIWDRLVKNALGLDKDSRIAYSDQLDNLPPVANGNGCWFGPVDDGETFATVELSAEDSFALDNNNTSGLTYDWDVGDGTITVGVSTDETITATFPGGFRHVTLTVTDADNLASARKEIPIGVDDGTTYASLPVMMEQSRCTQGEGWQMTFEVADYAQATIDQLPDGAFVCYYEREYYGGVESSQGSDMSGRSHIKFVGYLTRDSVSRDAETGRMSFEAVGPMGILARTGALPQILEEIATPANWQQIRMNTTNRILWYLWYWHTSAATVFDWTYSTNLDILNRYYRVATQNSNNLAEQIRDICNAFFYVFRCDRLGRFRFDVDADYETSRIGAFTNYASLEASDVISVDMDRNHAPPHLYKQVQLEGVEVAAQFFLTFAYFARASNAPTGGAGTDVRGNLLVNNQTQINEWAGHHFARVNGLYAENGVNFIAPQGVRLTMGDGWDVFDPELGQYLMLTGSITDLLPRDVTFSSARWWVRETIVSYDPEIGAKEVQVVVDHETFGLPGVTYTPPTEYDSGLTPPVGDDLYAPDYGTWEAPPLTPGALVKGATSIAGVAGAGTLYRTTDFEAASPTWSSTSLSAQVGDVLVDAFSPAYTGAGSAVNVWYVNGSGALYYLQDIFAATPTDTLKYNAAQGSDLRRWSIATERGSQNYVGILYIGTGGESTTDLYYSTDNSTFTNQQIVATGNNAALILPSVSHLSGRINGQGYYKGGNAIFKYTFGGAPTVFISTSDIPGGAFAIAWFYVPFGASGDDTVLYLSTTTDAFGAGATLWRYNRGTFTDITPLDGSTRYIPLNRLGKRPFSVADTDSNTIALVGYPGAAVDTDLCISRDGGNSWTIYPTTSSNFPTGVPYGCAVAGDNANTLYVWGGGGATNNAVINLMTLSGASVTADVNKLDQFGGTPIMNIFGG